MKTCLYDTYEILEPYASDSAYRTFLARHTRLGKLTLVKEYAGRRAAPEQTRREINILRNLKHPGLPYVLDVFSEDGKSYVVFEYVEGETLEQYVRNRGAASADQTIGWTSALLDILDYLQTAVPGGLVHCDVKPRNILLSSDGEIMLMNYDLAVPIGGKRIGYTLCYAGSEMLRNDTVDRRSDIYSVGATMYFLLTGSAPDSQWDNRTPLLERQIDTHLRRVIEKAMALDPADRYQSAKEMRNALNARKFTPRSKMLAFGGIVAGIFLGSGLLAALYRQKKERR